MLVVQKFGGSSVANAERVFNVAQIVTDTYKAGNDVVVVVSAQGDTTDDLIEKAKEINPSGSKREMDMLLAAGEQISISLLAMAIEKLASRWSPCSAGRPGPDQLHLLRRPHQAGEHRADPHGAGQKADRRGGGLPGAEPL